MRGLQGKRVLITGGASGIGAAMVAAPRACRRAMTFIQLDPSAQAPWTNTTVGFVFVAFMILTSSRVELVLNQPRAAAD